MRNERFDFSRSFDPCLHWWISVERGTVLGFRCDPIVEVILQAPLCKIMTSMSRIDWKLILDQDSLV